MTVAFSFMKGRELVKFFPYESVHTVAMITIEDDEHDFFMTLEEELRKYKAINYYQGSEILNLDDKFIAPYDVSIDNKITVKFADGLYLTYWDSVVSLGTEIHAMDRTLECCSIERVATG